MPRFSLDTNLPASKIPEEFLNAATSLLSKSLGKRQSYCVSTVNPGVKMTLGGSNDPCGFIQVTSIGSLGPAENPKHMEVLTDYVHKTLGIPKNRLLINLQANNQETTGYIGTTFHQLFTVEKGKRL
uniref:L-dopachrome isomerase n=1 Tax=Schizaphis graminum TaxID=13262 RepID=A0A2S2NPY7_SCHGA